MRAVALSRMGSYLVEECHDLIQGVKVTVLCSVGNKTVRTACSSESDEKWSKS